MATAARRWSEFARRRTGGWWRWRRGIRRRRWRRRRRRRARGGGRGGRRRTWRSARALLREASSCVTAALSRRRKCGEARRTRDEVRGSGGSSAAGARGTPRNHGAGRREVGCGRGVACSAAPLGGWCWWWPRCCLLPRMRSATAEEALEDVVVRAVLELVHPARNAASSSGRSSSSALHSHSSLLRRPSKT